MHNVLAVVRINAWFMATLSGLRSRCIQLMPNMAPAGSKETREKCYHHLKKFATVQLAESLLY